MPERSMIFRQTQDGVLLAPPSCGLLTVPDLIGQVRAWCAAGLSDTLVVDLSEVEHFETAALRSLVWCRRLCTANGRELVIVPPRDGVLELQDQLLLRAMLPVAPVAPVAPAAPVAVVAPTPAVAADGLAIA